MSVAVVLKVDAAGRTAPRVGRSRTSSACIARPAEHTTRSQRELVGKCARDLRSDTLELHAIDDALVDCDPKRSGRGFERAGSVSERVPVVLIPSDDAFREMFGGIGQRLADLNRHRPPDRFFGKFFGAADRDLAHEGWRLERCGRRILSVRRRRNRPRAGNQDGETPLH